MRRAACGHRTRFLLMAKMLAMMVSAVVSARITVAAAAIVGSVSRVTDAYMRTGSVCRYGLWMNSDSTTSSKLVANANSAPERTPGATWGSVMVRNVVH